jgi:hypothetical protein
MTYDGNQTENMIEEELEYILPDDYVEEEEESTEETEEATDEEVEETEEETTEEVEEVEEDTTETALEDMEVKFLHEVKALKDIPREELQSYVQKGMNHDRIQEKLNTAYDQIESFKDVADMFEMDLPSVIETLKNQYFTNKAETEGRQVTDVKREYEGNKKDRSAKMYDRFLTKYPDIKTEDIPQEVLQSVKEGEDLVKAYDKYTGDAKVKAKDTEIDTLKAQVEELQKKLGVKDQNTKVKKKAVVKKTSDSSGIDTDDFLAGLMGDY